jgi:hypothetical protein
MGYRGDRIEQGWKERNRKPSVGQRQKDGNREGRKIGNMMKR